MSEIEQINSFCKGANRGPFPDGGVGLVIEKLISVGDKDTTKFLQHMTGDFDPLPDHIRFEEIVTGLFGPPKEVGQWFFIDLRAFFEAEWWKVGEAAQQKRIKILLNDFAFLAVCSRDDAEKTLSSLDRDIGKFNSTRSEALNFYHINSLKVYTVLTGDLEADTKIYFYLLFLINSDNFVRSYKRNVIDDDFGGKDYASFEKICQKFIKDKIIDSDMCRLLQKYGWVPEQGVEWNWSDARKSVWQKK